METLIGGKYFKEDLIKQGLTEEQIKHANNAPHGSSFKLETWFTILTSSTNKMIRTDGYYYAIKKHPACVLVAATLESMSASRVAQGGIPENEPERSKALQSNLPYVLTIAYLIREDCYSGSKLWGDDTLELANRVIKRTRLGVLPLKTVEGKKYFDDKIDMLIDYASQDLNSIPVFKEEVKTAKQTYGDIASQLNVGGTNDENKAVKLFMNTFRKPSNELVALRLEFLLAEKELESLQEKDSKKLFSSGKNDKIVKAEQKLNDINIRLSAQEMIG